MNSSATTSQHLFPPVISNWADKLYAFGLIVFAIASNFSISASQISLGLALIGCVGMIRQGKLSATATPLAAPFAFMAMTGLMSAFTAEEPIKAITEMKSFLIIIVFYLAYWPPMTKNFQQKLIYTFIFSAAFVSLANNVQIFSGAIDGKHTKGFYSMCITFGECMALAGVTTLLALATNDFGKKFNFFLLLALGLITSSMIFALNRGAWLGFMVGSFVLTIRFPKRLLPIIAVFLVLAGSAALQNSDFRERLSGFNLQKTLATANKSLESEVESVALYSNLQRLYIWMRGFVMLENNFAFGVGQRNVKTHYKKLASQFEANNGLIWGHQHNNFMQMLAMNGFIGLTAFFYLLVVFVRFVLGRLPESTNATANLWQYGAIGVLASFIVFGFTEYVWGDEEVIMMAFFILGLLMNKTAGQIPDGSEITS